MSEEPLTMDVIIDGVTERRAATWQVLREEYSRLIEAGLRVPRPVLRHGEIEVRTISGETFMFRSHN